MLCLYHQDRLVETKRSPFLEIQCGKALSEISLPMQGDNLGDNISDENQFWSEITGLYWAWKNIATTKYVGLCSYRRFFNLTDSSEPLELVSIQDGQHRIDNLNYEAIEVMLKTVDIIMPVPYTYPCSIRRVCSKNYRDDDFDFLEVYIKEYTPDYYSAYQKVMYSSNTAVGHNMFVMRGDDFEEYCSWVFGVLFAMKEKLEPTDYPITQRRVFGYMHELLLAVYVEKRNFRVQRSQILWVTDEFFKSRFNQITYRAVCNLIFHVSKLLGCLYPHKLKKTSVGSS